MATSDSQLYIRPVCTDMEKFAFAESYFDIPVQLVDDSDTVYEESIQFNAICKFENSEELVPNGFCQFENCFTNVSGKGIVRAYFSEQGLHTHSHTHPNKRIVVTFLLGKKYKNLDILPGKTGPIAIIRHKLIIEEENSTDYVWYKDEGGKDKCIELKVHLVDKLGNEIKNRKVPLKLTLVYKPKPTIGSELPINQRVTDQNLLAVNSESHMMIDDKPATIKVRISEVSNRHQGQMFQIMVSPDIDHMHSLIDISSESLSLPIDVKSKRNNHKLDKDNRSETGTDLTVKKNKIETKLAMQNAVNNLFLQKNGTTSGNTVEQNNINYMNASTHSGVNSGTGVSSTGSLVGGHISSSGSVAGVGGSQQSAVKREISQGGMTNNINGSTTSLSAREPIISPVMEQPSTSRTSLGSDDGGRYVTYIEPTNIHAALENVATWVGTVMVNLKEIQWRQLGYAIKADGSPDANFPLYSIPNPITTINNISHQYATFVDPSLRLLSNKINDSNMSGMSGGGMEEQLGPPMVSSGGMSLKNPNTMSPRDSHRSGTGAVLPPASLGPSPRNSQMSGGMLSLSRNVSGSLLPDSRIPLSSYNSNNTGGGLSGNKRKNISNNNNSNGNNFNNGNNEIVQPPTFSRTFTQSIQGIAPPQLMRSSTLQEWTAGGSNSLLTETTNFDTNIFMERSLSYDTAGVESAVYYIIARSYSPDGVNEFGLPAYDVSKSLIGFYRQGDEFGVTIPIFTVSSTVSALNENIIQRLLKLLDDCLRSNDSSVFSLLKYPSYFEMANEAIIYDMCNTFPSFES